MQEQICFLASQFLMKVGDSSSLVSGISPKSIVDHGFEDSMLIERNRRVLLLTLNLQGLKSHWGLGRE